MHRFYVSQDQSDGSVAILSPEDVHHAARVLRLPSTEPALSVTLFQGIPKGEKMD